MQIMFILCITGSAQAYADSGHSVAAYQVVNEVRVWGRSRSDFVRDFSCGGNCLNTEYEQCKRSTSKGST